MNQLNKMDKIKTEDPVASTMLQFGLLSSLLSILYYVGLYLLGAESFMKPIAYFSYAIPIIFAVVASIKVKKSSIYLPFGQALKIVFGVLVLSFLGLSLFSFFLNNYIDTAFAERTIQLTIQKTQEMMIKFKVPQSEIDKQIKTMLTMDMYSFGSIMKGFLYQCIFLFLLSLIIAVIVKKNKPEFTA